MSILTFLKDNSKYRIEFDGTPTLKELLLQEGFADFLPCAKTGACVGCEYAACKKVLNGNTTINNSTVVIETKTKFDAKANGRWKLGCALDIGTTTVVLKIFSKALGCIATKAAINPQREISTDVIGRISHALNGSGKLLQDKITGCIDELLQKACDDAKIDKNDIDQFVVTGNTAMLYLLTNKCPKSIASAPFKADTLFGIQINNVYLPRCMDAFVGADITCSILASGMTDKNETALLCDIGTNGEIALYKNGKLYVTSTAAGPVFEGAGIACGCLGIPGAIDKVYIVNGQLTPHTIENKKAVGICGSGVIDALACTLDIELMDKTGAVEGDILLADGVCITQSDIRELQLAKAAIRAGINVLLKQAELSASDIDTLYIAGGFGSHINLNNAARIGLIPKELVSKAMVLGNGALSGAAMMLYDSDNIKKSLEIVSFSHHVTLGGNDEFNDEFINNMYF